MGVDKRIVAVEEKYKIRPLNFHGIYSTALSNAHVIYLFVSL